MRANGDDSTVVSSVPLSSVRMSVHINQICQSVRLSVYIIHVSLFVHQPKGCRLLILWPTIFLHFSLRLCLSHLLYLSFALYLSITFCLSLSLSLSHSLSLSLFFFVSLFLSLFHFFFFFSNFLISSAFAAPWKDTYAHHVFQRVGWRHDVWRYRRPESKCPEPSWGESPLCLSIYPSVCLSEYLIVCPFICASVYLPVWLSVSLPVCLFEKKSSYFWFLLIWLSFFLLVYVRNMSCNIAYYSIIFHNIHIYITSYHIISCCILINIRW